MKKYQLIYTVCDGNHEMDVFTGFTVIAVNHIEAMQAAQRLNSILITDIGLDHFQVNICFDHAKSYTIKILANGLPVRKSRIQKFRVEKNHISKDCMEADDYDEVSETAFVKSLQDTYSHSKNILTFEPISFGVEKII